jgi:hypothetical protein
VVKGSDETAVIGSIKDDVPNIPAGSYPVSETFRVKFPKIYYPNRNIPVSVTVKIQIEGSLLAKEMTFTQSPLTSQGMFPYSPQTLGYGNIHGGSANYRYVQELRKQEAARPSTSLTVNNNYMHMNYYGLTQNYDWTEVTTFRKQRDGLLFVVNDLDYNPHLGMINNSYSVLADLDYVTYPVEGIETGHYAIVNMDAAVKASKVYQMIIKGVGGATADIESYMNQSGTKMFEDNISTGVKAYPTTAVPIVLSSRIQNWGGVQTNEGKPDVLMTIDPKNNIIYQGESQLFDTTNCNMFLGNFIIYVKLASMWGSSFTDLMFDGQGALPAPWDDAWGANKGISE